MMDFYKGFQIWDFIVIFLVADLSQAVIMSVLMGTATWWTIITLGFAVMIWKFHIWTVKNDIKAGRR